MVRGNLPDVELSQKPLHDAVRDSCMANPDRTALVDGVTGLSCTYGELSDIIVRVASGFRRLGVAKGDIVAVLCPNCIEFFYALLGVVANGAIATFVNPTYTTYELEYAFKLTKPKWILTVPELIGKAAEAARNVSVRFKGTIAISRDSEGSPKNAIAEGRGGAPLVPFETLMEDDGSWYPADVEIDSSKDVAFILFSSGTTGLPKGVMLSHYNIVAMMTITEYANRTSSTVQQREQQIVVISFLPLFHAAGLMSAVNSLAANQKVIVLNRFPLDRVLQCVEKYKITVFFLIPSVCLLLTKSDLISKYDLSSVRRYIIGSAPISAETLRNVIKVTGCSDIRQGYGLTELTLSAINSASVSKLKIGSIGVPVPNTEAQVVDPETGQVLGANQRGEICIKGPQMMLGYLNDPEATKTVIDNDGWLHTGDLGYYDEDGYFFIVDRMKEIIKYKAFQVSPAELEALLLTHPEVIDVAVVGVPDKEAGELPKAFVVRKPGSKVTAEQIKQLVAGKVSSYKHLRGGVEFVETTPRSETGKILRRQLKHGAANQSSKL